MYQFVFTARYWDEDKANDFCGTVWADSEYDAHCIVEEMHPEADSILLKQY